MKKKPCRILYLLFVVFTLLAGCIGSEKNYFLEPEVIYFTNDSSALDVSSADEIKLIAQKMACLKTTIELSPLVAEGESQANLFSKRADEIKNLLLGIGVSADDIKVMKKPIANPYPDIIDGKIMNRCVVVTFSSKLSTEE